MRPLVVAWLAAHRLPAWLAPDYFVLVALSTVAAAAIALRLVRTDGADRRPQVRAMLVAYVAALAGGYVVEGLRQVPAALAAASFGPIVHAGRAAYGGLLGAMLAVAVYLHFARQPLGAFFDRVAIGTGLVFAAVRTGCFLAGCDYGRVTASRFGVHFPPGSLAALDHAARGFVPAGARSLPVHPTELYEALLGLAAAAAAWWFLFRARRGRRDGRAFLAWLAVYAGGRFAIEFLRGDETRGVYLGLSTAQYISIGLLIFAGIAAFRINSAESCTAPGTSAAPAPSA